MKSQKWRCSALAVRGKLVSLMERTHSRATRASKLKRDLASRELLGKHRKVETKS
jgi:hypothetical protein